MTVIDFNSPINFGQITFPTTLKGLANAHRANNFLTTDRLPAKTRIRQMCSSISWQLSDKNFFLLRSIPLYGFCSNNISTEPSGHRNLSASNAFQTLSLRHPWKSFSQHPGQSKRESRLANICRLRRSVDKHCTEVNEDFGVQLKQAAYALDSTTIDLCLSLFPWAKFRKHKAAVKVHTLMDLRGSIPCFIRITGGKVHDVNILDELVLEAGSFYIMDRGYIDFARLFSFTQNLSFFATRAKSNFDYRRFQYYKVDKTTGLRCDQMIRLNGYYASQDYPAVLRRISYFDTETKKRFVFLTNNFTLPALTIVRLYKCRWRIEIFFKWIKQYLRIKTFFGTTQNAVKTQIWIAIKFASLIMLLQCSASA
jgi:hypothetical protein